MKILIALLILTVHFAWAKESPCDPKVKFHKDKNLSSLREAVEKALTSGSAAKVKALIACDFSIGKTESDINGFRRGAKVSAAIAKLLKGVQFKKTGENYGDQVSVESENPVGSYTLIYRKDESSNWYWAGLSLVDSDILDRLLKGSYSMGSSEDED